MDIIVSETPTIYIPEREQIISLANQRFIGIYLDNLIEKTKDLSEVTKTVLSRALEILTTYAISFHVNSIEKERDVEDSTWEYVMVRVRIEVDKEHFNKIYEKVVGYAYSAVNPEDATKVLLILENV